MLLKYLQLFLNIDIGSVLLIAGERLALAKLVNFATPDSSKIFPHLNGIEVISFFVALRRAQCDNNKKDLTDSPTNNNQGYRLCFSKKQLQNYAVLLLNKIVTLRINFE